MPWLYDQSRFSCLCNFGSGNARSFADLAGAVFQALGRSPDINYIDTPDALRQQYQYFTEARMERLVKAGCDVIPTPLEEGVRRYVQEYLLAADIYR